MALFIPDAAVSTTAGVLRVESDAFTLETPDGCFYVSLLEDGSISIYGDAHFGVGEGGKLVLTPRKKVETP